MDSARNCSDHEETTGGRRCRILLPRGAIIYFLYNSVSTMRVLKYYPSFITALIPLSLFLYFFLSVFGEIEATYAMYVFHLGPYIAPCVCARVLCSIQTLAICNRVQGDSCNVANGRIKSLPCRESVNIISLSLSRVWKYAEQFARRKKLRS